MTRKTVGWQNPPRLGAKANVEIMAQFPPKLHALFEPHRFKVLYGGRGGGKSWGIARALLLIAHEHTIRVLCARELMKSIGQSVHQLLVDQIFKLGLSDFYTIEQAAIRGRNGSEFKFAGMKSNVQQIKSYEGVNICWIEEAANVSDLSWDTLLPTLRGEGYTSGTDAEIWISFNPEHETDSTYQRFVVDPPANALVIKMNYSDNPFFTSALQKEMETMKEKDYEKYLHIYEGECRKYLEGAIYTEELKRAAEISEDQPQSRITRVPYDPSTAVYAFVDLGWADQTAIWIVQKVGFQVHVLEYIEGTRRTLDSYFKQLSLLPYAINEYFLPHDARQRNAASNGRSTEDIFRAKGFKVRIVPDIAIAAGIDAVRTMFPSVWFDKKRCADGIHALRHYRFEVIQDGLGGFKDKPVHDRYSNAADAFRYVAVGLKNPKPKPAAGKYRARHIGGSSSGWMAL